MEILLESYCGLECNKCDYQETQGCNGCFSCAGNLFYGKCEIAECVLSKKKKFCGECEDFPCELLKRYSYDPEHGENGGRIERCREIKIALSD